MQIALFDENMDVYDVVVALTDDTNSSTLVSDLIGK